MNGVRFDLHNQQALQIALPVQQPQIILQSMVYPLIPVMMYS